MGSAIGGAKIAANKLGITLDEYTRRRASGEKWCWECRAWHPLRDFSSNSDKADGKSTNCRTAQSRYQRSRREARKAA